MNYSKHVVCAISGGVDSAVAAYLLKRDGFKLTGCYMKNWNRLDENDKSCTNDNDMSDARHVCKMLDIPFMFVDFTKQYWNFVFEQFLNEYEQGLTPNPDILCNKYIKFPLLLNYSCSKLDSFDYIATGHYARLKFDSHINKFRLLKSKDELKDQTFFLSQIDSKLFEKILFPIGDYDKKEVRKMASEIGLKEISKKKSSVGICFIGKRKFTQFIGDYIEKQKGSIYDLESNAYLGEHNGIHEYTIGQRIVIQNDLNKQKRAYFVAKKELDSKLLYAVSDTNHPALYFNQFQIEKPHWICENKEEKQTKSGLILDKSFDFKFQNKHLQAPIEYLKRESNEYVTKLQHPFRGIAPGQYCVFYKDDECVGSGKILKTSKSMFDLKYDKNKILNSDKLFTKSYYSKFQNILIDCNLN